MAKTETSTPEEKPLHDIVLELMFEEGKERPVHLSVKEIFWKFTDETVTENNVIEVLKWLVHQKRVEYSSGKYALDRFEFLEQRRLANAEVGPDGKLKPAAFTKSEIPLHDVILSLMFEADSEKPAEFSVDDIFWKISDPSVLEGQVIEVLKWLLHHKRVDFQAGKYSLDRFEFLDQTKEEKTTVKTKKTRKTAKKVVDEAPKGTKFSKIQKAPRQTKEGNKPLKNPRIESTTRTPKAEPVSVSKIEEVNNAPEPKAEIVHEETSQTVEKKPIVNNVLLSLAAVFFVYTFYLLLFASSEMTPETSSQVQDEIVSAESRLTELTNKEDDNLNRIKIVEEKLNLIQVISARKSERLARQNSSNYYRLRSLIVRLLLSNIFILLIFGIVYYRRVLPNSRLNKTN